MEEPQYTSTMTSYSKEPPFRRKSRTTSSNHRVLTKFTLRFFELVEKYLNKGQPRYTVTKLGVKKNFIRGKKSELTPQKPKGTL